ncbi:GNAT family N-acetyltransferase [Haloimpatiens sp. FM7315]|uniref:GNAT family N-acetyltransferase n=1 Tax=Haloimpatiens sp. FM7315 TaxID=3298609 RepID=UPI0035A3478A
MNEKTSVFLELVKGSKVEYIVKDKDGITVGRIFILELDREEQFCAFKLNFYRYGKEGFIQLKDTLSLMMVSLFRNMGVYKLDVIVSEEVELEAFIDLGFKLEGILQDSQIKEGNKLSKFIFGIDYDVYESNTKRVPLKLKGDTIELKVLTPEDADRVLNYYLKNKKHLMAFEPMRDDEFYTLEHHKKNLIERYKNYLNGSGIDFGIFKGNKFLGIIKISNVVYGVFKSAFVGYSIDGEQEGKGYMTEALKLVIKYSFEELGLHRIEASTLIDNKRSQGVLKNNGFKELGLNKNYLFINGKWRDHITFYKTK